MSSSTRIPAGASLQRFALSEPEQTNDGTAAIITAALWEGNYSAGRQSDYQRRPIRWVTVEARDATTFRTLYYKPHYPRRQCRQFTGKQYDKALRDFGTICHSKNNVPLREGTPAEAHRYYHNHGWTG